MSTTGPQAQPTWMVTFCYASDNDAGPWNLFESELICEANLSFADNIRSAMDFGSSGELRISGIHLRLRRGSWLALARTHLRRTQLKTAAGDISSEVPVDFDISDQGILSHQKLTKAEFGTNARIATSVRVKDLPSTAACSHWRSRHQGRRMPNQSRSKRPLAACCLAIPSPNTGTSLLLTWMVWQAATKHLSPME